MLDASVIKSNKGIVAPIESEFAIQLIRFERVIKGMSKSYDRL